VWVGEESGMFSHVKTGFFAAASFMSLNQCHFNFGHKPFTFPPPKHVDFKTFNDHSQLKPEEKIVLPRPEKLELIRSQSVIVNPCILCFDSAATVALKPCDHAGFCAECAKQLDICPMCRGSISQVETVEQQTADSAVL